MTQLDIKSKWIKASSIGWLLSIIVILILSAGFDSIGIEGMQFYLGIGIGTGVGYMQWRLLKRVANIGINWLWATICGIGLPFLCFDLLNKLAYISFGDRYLLYSVSIAGFLCGILQVLVLRKYARKAGIWLPVSFASWLVTALIFLTINYSGKVFSNNWICFSYNLVIILSGGVILGALTSTTINNIIKNTKHQD